MVLTHYGMNILRVGVGFNHGAGEMAVVLVRPLLIHVLVVLGKVLVLTDGLLKDGAPSPPTDVTFVTMSAPAGQFGFAKIDIVSLLATYGCPHFPDSFGRPFVTAAMLAGSVAFSLEICLSRDARSATWLTGSACPPGRFWWANLLCIRGRCESLLSC